MFDRPPLLEEPFAQTLSGKKVPGGCISSEFRVQVGQRIPKPPFHGGHAAAEHWGQFQPAPDILGLN